MAPTLEVLVGDSAPADLTTIDELARLQLAGRRAGLTVTLVEVPSELRMLIELCGLAEALRIEP